jgi:hypothetical protein
LPAGSTPRAGESRETKSPGGFHASGAVVRSQSGDALARRRYLLHDQFATGSIREDDVCAHRA